MKGQHFGFLCLLCASWISTRVAVLSFIGPEQSSRPAKTASPLRPRPSSAIAVAPSQSLVSGCCRKSAYLKPEVNMKASIRKLATSLHPATFQAPAPAKPPTPVALAAAFDPGMWPNSNRTADKEGVQRFQFYAYSFWRNGSGANSLGLAQYGGGQSGLIATYQVAPRFSLLVRRAIAHDRIGEQEVAAGIRWTPLRKADLSLTAERRLRSTGNDALAVYIAGGESALPLPLQFELDAYGQAGFVSGRDASLFFDAQARASREIFSVANMPVKVGGGAWAGGQKGAARLDIGPSLGTEMKLGETILRIDADWRFRVAGDALPASGPALTLSTSF